MMSIRKIIELTMFCSLLCLYQGNKLVAEQSPPVVHFNRDIRPILTDKCLHCHGPDASTREADLRLDDVQSLLLDRGGEHIIVPGKPQQSELYLRITADDPADQMPPADSDKQLSIEEIKLIRLWIEQGASYEKHWSLVPPRRPIPPKVSLEKWPRNEIDTFILSRLDTEALLPSREAERGTLLRRVSLDLTGLPPSLQELEEFLADKSPDAYEKAVDRLLNSNRYGEHKARYWLDAARYADTNGFFVDGERTMWGWRNCVIDAFNSNMPFDQFTVEQLAGDLLPNATESQLIASGFNRNHMTTRETGIIDEEYRVEYIVDCIETTSTVWLGMTMGCARCHDHKYDPISQEEFYQFFALFNSNQETGLKKEAGNSSPMIKVPTSEFTTRLKSLHAELAIAEKETKKIEVELTAAQSKWESTILAQLHNPSSKGLISHFDMESMTSQAESNFQEDIFGKAAVFKGDTVFEVESKIEFERTDSFSYGAWIKSTAGSPACVLSKNDDVNSLRGFDLMIRKGKAVVHLIHKWNSDAIQVMTQTSIPSNQWQHVMVTYNGSGKASGIFIYLNGIAQPVDVRYDRLQGSIQTTQPLRIGRRSTSAAFNGFIDEVRIYDHELTAKEVHQLASSQFLNAMVSIPANKRTSTQQKQLRNVFITEYAEPRFQSVYSKLNKFREQLRSHQKSIPTAMVMQDLPESRDTFVLVRGEYNEHGKKVTAAVPAMMPPFPEEAQSNRLGLAQWLVHQSNPLTARVTVNRYWQHIFGTGIVKTVEDFGSQGEWPSHPDLLDWLAVEFIESGWDVKHIHRLIVTSATYRQSSKVTPQKMKRLQSIDSHNRLLAHGPRFRLDAESIRDNALAISGLMTDQTGGASVKPYQPKGLWEAVSYDGNLIYRPDQGDALYRRSIYTYWKRQSPPPGMLAFDAPTRETCTVRRPRTNTPLQALVVMNDITYVEASRAMAQRIMTEPDRSTPTAKIQFAFQLAIARLPSVDELKILLDLSIKQSESYKQNPQLAQQLIQVGDSQPDLKLDPVELAVWTTIASVILCMDETMTK